MAFDNVSQITDLCMREALAQVEPCPFCGKAPVMFQDSNLGGFEPVVALRCNQCSVSMSTNARNGADGIASMLRRWNKRVAPTVERVVEKFEPIGDEL